MLWLLFLARFLQKLNLFRKNWKKLEKTKLSVHSLKSLNVFLKSMEICKTQQQMSAQIIIGLDMNCFRTLLQSFSLDSSREGTKSKTTSDIHVYSPAPTKNTQATESNSSLPRITCQSNNQTGDLIVMDNKLKEPKYKNGVVIVDLRRRSNCQRTNVGPPEYKISANGVQCMVNSFCLFQTNRYSSLSDRSGLQLEREVEWDFDSLSKM